ncbi:MAG TPA: sigma-70 family RNA polymerase sigma factor [Polyangiaceae bacterium]
MASRQPTHAEALPETKPALAEADDTSLALALIAGDAFAPRIAWNRFSPMVRGMLRRSFGPASEVEDLVQDVFLSLFRNVSKLRQPATLRAFVIGITVRTLRYELRRRRVRSWIGLSPNPEIGDLRVVHPDTESREALVRFYELLDRINTRDRTAFVLHFVEGMDANEVAVALNTSVPTVRRCLGRAWKRVVLLAERDPALVDYVAKLDAEQKSR